MNSTHLKSKKSLRSEHLFEFDQNFELENLQRPEHSEVKFFCEAFSLFDSMRRTKILLRFTNMLGEQKGLVRCSQIIQLIRDEKPADKISLPETSEDEEFQFLLNLMYQIISDIVLDGYVTCMHTSTLGCRAWEAGQIYLGKTRTGINEREPNNNVGKKQRNDHRIQIGLAWQELGERLQDLAEYQRQHKKIHHDFQKSNYAPDPRTKAVYGSTFALIILGFLFTLFRACTIAETKEFVNLLKK